MINIRSDCFCSTFPPPCTCETAVSRVTNGWWAEKTPSNNLHMNFNGSWKVTKTLLSSNVTSSWSINVPIKDVCLLLTTSWRWRFLLRKVTSATTGMSSVRREHVCGAWLTRRDRPSPRPTSTNARWQACGLLWTAVNTIMEQLEFRGCDLLWQKSEMWANEVHLENRRMGHFTLRLMLKRPHRPGEAYVKLSSQSGECRRKEQPDLCLWALGVSLLKAWTLNRDGMADTSKWYSDRIGMSKRTSPISKIAAKCRYKLNDCMSPISHDNPVVLESHIAYYLSWVFHF